jgi:hypothetical protein
VPLVRLLFHDLTPLFVSFSRLYGLTWQSKICREPVSKQSSLLTLGMDIGRAAKVPGSPDVRVIQVRLHLLVPMVRLGQGGGLLPSVWGLIP